MHKVLSKPFYRFPPTKKYYGPPSLSSCTDKHLSPASCLPTPPSPSVGCLLFPLLTEVPSRSLESRHHHLRNDRASVRSSLLRFTFKASTLKPLPKATPFVVSKETYPVEHFCPWNARIMLHLAFTSNVFIVSRTLVIHFLSKLPARIFGLGGTL